MIIRQATVDDATAIATIHVRSWQHAYRDLLPADQLASLSIHEHTVAWQHRLDDPGDAHTEVAEIEGMVVGFASWGIDPAGDPADRMLFSIYLAPEAMGHGTGSLLLDHVEHGMKAEGARRGTLHVLVANTPTHRFYKRHGWTMIPESDMTEEFFGISVDTVGFQKPIVNI